MITGIGRKIYKELAAGQIWETMTGTGVIICFYSYTCSNKLLDIVPLHLDI